MKRNPAKAEDITPEWIAGVRDALVRDGQRVRRGPDSSIEVESKNKLGWCLLNLPGETCYFVTKDDRDVIFNQIKP